MRDVPLPIVFGSEDDERRYCEEVRYAKLAQGSRFAIAPRCRVTTPTGQLLEAGDEVTPSDFVDAADAMGRPMSPMARLRQLVRSGHVIERDDLPLTGPEAA